MLALLVSAGAATDFAEPEQQQSASRREAQNRVLRATHERSKTGGVTLHVAVRQQPEPLSNSGRSVAQNRWC